MSSQYPHGTYVPPIVNAPRSERAQAELDEMLPTDEQLEAAGMLPPRMGRPSQGREKRLQFSATAEMEAWLEARRIESGKKSISEVVFEIIHQVMEQK